MLSGLLPGISPEQRSEVASTLALGSVAIWARLLQQISLGVEQAYQRYAVMNVLQTAQTAVLSAGWLGVALATSSIVDLMKWQAAVSLLFLAIHLFFCLRLLGGVALRPAWSFQKAVAIVQYSMATWVGALGTVLFSQADRLIVGALLGPVALGIYAAVVSVTVQINVLSAMAVEPQFPVLAQMFAAKPIDMAVIQERVRHALGLNAAGALSFGAALLACSSFILPLLVPNAAPEHLVGFRAAIIIYTIYSLNVVGTYILYSVDQVPICSTLVIASGVLSLGLIALGAVVFGLLGAFLGGVGYIGTLGVYWFAMRKLNLPPTRWLAWLNIPLGCLAIGAALIMLLPAASRFAPLIGFAQLCVIIAWFLAREPELVQSVINRFHLLRSKS